MKSIHWFLCNLPMLGIWEAHVTQEHLGPFWESAHPPDFGGLWEGSKTRSKFGGKSCCRLTPPAWPLVSLSGG
jgi:hypothetical protein